MVRTGGRWKRTHQKRGNLANGLPVFDHEPEAVGYARRQAGLTKTELAERCGVSLSLISEIESGTRNATPAMLNKLAAALNCPRVVLERKREPAGRPASTGTSSRV